MSVWVYMSVCACVLSVYFVALVVWQKDFNKIESFTVA